MGLLLIVPSQVVVNPSADGLPGAERFQQALNWTAQFALWGSLASVLVGAAVWGLSNHFGNGYAAGKGRVAVVGGAIGAFVAGLAPPIVNGLSR